MVQLMPLHPKTSSSLASFKSRVFTSLVPAKPGCPGKEVIKLVNSSSNQGKTHNNVKEFTITWQEVQINSLPLSYQNNNSYCRTFKALNLQLLNSSTLKDF